MPTPATLRLFPGAAPGTVLQINAGGTVLQVTVPPGAPPGAQIPVNF